MTKLYKFQQILYNHQEPYFEMIGTFETIMYRWFHSPAYTELASILLDVNKQPYTKEYNNILMCLNKQGFYIELVDEDCYGMGWVTKIIKLEE